MRALVDNDVLFKGACYNLLDEFFGVIPGAPDPIGILGVARFVLASKIRKKNPKPNSSTVLNRLLIFLKNSKPLEPTNDEQLLAAELELFAQRARLALDSGESQLCSILIVRRLPLMITGDKRAIMAMENLVGAHPNLNALCGKVKCLEQLVSDVLAVGNEVKIRNLICEQPEIDKTLSICFGCVSMLYDAGNILEGLGSYIRDLRRNAERVLYS